MADTEVGHTRIPAGAQVVLDLATTDLELGAGPHHCPGAPVALALLAGILDALPLLPEGLPTGGVGDTLSLGK